MADEPLVLNIDKLHVLANKYYGEFHEQEAFRQTTKETEWLENIRQCKGVHDPEIKKNFIQGKDSEIYSNYTRSKEDPLRAKLTQHLIPEKEKNWQIRPTPKPDVPEDKLQDIITPILQPGPYGQIKFPSDDAIDEAIDKWTSERCENMERTIADQMVDSTHKENQREQIKSAIRYGTGIIKGPVTESYFENTVEFQTVDGAFQKVISFLKNFVTTGVMKPGNWVQRRVEKFRPASQFTPVWNFFPDFTAMELRHANFVYELHSFNKSELKKLALRSDFQGDIINSVIKQFPEGNYKMRSWETYLSTLSEDQAQKANSKNYELVERNGYIDATDLKQAGLLPEDADESANYFANFWILDSKCVKIMLWPEKVIRSLVDLYHLFYYEKDETSIMGTGLPKVIRHRQLAINAGERYLLGHARWLVEPCGEINVTKLHPDSKTTVANFGPGDFLFTTGMGPGDTGKIINQYYMQDNVNSILEVINFQKMQGDAESSVFSALFGAPSGGDETAKGVSVRYGGLVDFLKELAKNFDEANVSYIKAVYRWNMEFNPDEKIKGDMHIRAVGSAAALIKDAVREQVSFFMQSLASMPEDVQAHFNKNKLAGKLAKAMFDDIEGLILPNDQVQQKLDDLKQKSNAMFELQKTLAEVKAFYERAKADHMEAKAQKIMAETPHDIQARQIQNAKESLEVVKSATPGGEGGEPAGQQ